MTSAATAAINLSAFFIIAPNHIHGRKLSEFHSYQKGGNVRSWPIATDDALTPSRRFRGISRNPIVVVLSGPLGTGDPGWPSAFRGIGAMPPVHVQMEENLKPI